MMLLLMLLLPPDGEGLTFERTVHATMIDWLGRVREIRREETVRLRDGRISITDRTFGVRLVILPDEKRLFRADPLAGTYSEYTFAEIARIRGEALDELRSAKERVAGTPEERTLAATLESYGEYASPPSAELRAEGDRREILLGGDRLVVSVEVDPDRKAGGLFAALSAVGAFHPAVAEKIGRLEGFPMKGTIRSVRFLDRLVERFEVTSVSEGPVPDEAFARPEGLRKVPLERFGRPPERIPPRPEGFERSRP